MRVVLSIGAALVLDTGAMFSAATYPSTPLSKFTYTQVWPAIITGVPVPCVPIACRFCNPSLGPFGRDRTFTRLSVQIRFF